MNSVLTKKQTKKFAKQISEKERMTVTIRFDDECNNGHNTFSITGTVFLNNRSDMFGCLHDQIREHFPELSHLIKWHLCSTDGPLHYIANAKFWAGFTKWQEQDVDMLHSTIIYGTVPEFDDNSMKPEYMTEGELECWLQTRLPLLLKEFRKDIESLGFVW